MPNDFPLVDYFDGGAIAVPGRFAQLDEAGSIVEGSLTYCLSLQYAQIAARNPHVSAVLTTPALASEITGKGVAVDADPRLAFFRLYNRLYEQGLMAPAMDFGIGQACRIHPTALVSPRARIGDRVEIGPYAVIEEHVEILNDCYIGQGVVVGAEGLITLWNEDDTPLRVRHGGGVRLGRGVQVLAGAIVARSLFQRYTTIGDYCQIGIMANVGHGAQIDARCILSSNTVIAGRTTLGAKTWVGASACVAQGLTVGAGAQIKMGAVVATSIGPGEVVSGNFAVPHRANMKHYHRVKTQ